MKKALLLLFASVFTFMSYGQIEVCGNTDGKPITDRLLANRKYFEDKAFKRGGITYVPLQFHLVANSSGVGRLNERDALQSLCYLNEQYQGTDIQFYYANDFNYIDNTNLYENPRSINAGFTMQANLENDAMNLFVTNVADPNATPGTVTNGFWDPTFDWLVMRKATLINNPAVKTIAHEIGHYFALPHTFNGWDGSCSDNLGWCPAEHGNPVGTTSPNGVPTERQNGSNGLTAGDYIADTTPNYLFGLRWGDCSQYTGGAMDPSGTIVDPQENNFMGYFGNCSDFTFTAGQVTVMQQSLASPDRGHLETDYTPPVTSFTEEVELDPPFSLNTTPGAPTSVEFTWSQVPGATRYMLEIARNPGFTIFYQSHFTQGTTLTVPGFTAGQGTWYWRVKAFNRYYACADFVSDNFVPGENTSALEPIRGLESFSVYPNPTEVNGSATVQIETNELLDVNIVVYDMLGSVVLQKDAGSFSGSSNIKIAGFDAPGLYVVMLNTDKGQAVKKLIVD